MMKLDHRNKSIGKIQWEREHVCVYVLRTNEEDEPLLRLNITYKFTHSRVSIKRQQHLQNFIDADRSTKGFLEHKSLNAKNNGNTHKG